MWPVGQAVKTPASHAGNAGSIPARVTISLVSSPARAVNTKAGVYYGEVPPVPIPNTEVKLTCAEDTWREAARKNRSSPAPPIAVPFPGAAIPYSSLAQSVEHAAVNRRVVCSSQTGGARIEPLSSDQRLYFRRRAFSSVGQSDRLITGWSRVRIPEGPPVGSPPRGCPARPPALQGAFTFVQIF